jgi:hypothetical protein
MASISRFHYLVLSVTVFVMFWGVGFLAPLVTHVSTTIKFASSIGAVLASIGVYKLTANIVEILLAKSVKIRFWMLGPYFMHGTWIGIVADANGNHELVVEHFEQDLKSMTIRGRTYTKEKKERAMWTSGALHIDTEKGVLSYEYTGDVHSSNVRYQGIAVFYLERKDKDLPPDGIDGYIADLRDGLRMPVREKKISNELLPWAKALLLAEDYYSESS